MTKMMLNEVLLVVVIGAVLPASGNNLDNECMSLTSCSSCIEKSSCVWCVIKSKCTKQDCGHDNIIYPDNVPAILSGPGVCPRVESVVEPNVRTFKSREKYAFVVKITQIHLYMVFTPWKCKVSVADNETVVDALIVADTVYCQAALLENKSDSASVDGTVSVLWDFSKCLDGHMPIKVCRCDLDPECSACQ